MRLVLLIAACAALAGCGTTLADVTSNPNCVTRVTIKGSYGGGIPTGSYSAGAVCGAAKPKGFEGIPPAPPAEDKTPPA